MSPLLEYGIPKLWAGLERLELSQANGLTRAMITDVLPQMTKLKTLVLPKDILLDERGKFNYEAIEKMVNRRPPIDFRAFKSRTACIFKKKD